jgi:hypothetical protein
VTEPTNDLSSQQPELERLDEVLLSVQRHVRALILLGHELLRRDLTEGELRLAFGVLFETVPYRTCACWIPEDKVLPHLVGVRSGSNLTDVVDSSQRKGFIKVHLADAGRLFQFVFRLSDWNVGFRKLCEQRDTARRRIRRATKQLVMDLVSKELDEVLKQLDFESLLGEGAPTATAEKKRSEEDGSLSDSGRDAPPPRTETETAEKKRSRDEEAAVSEGTDGGVDAQPLSDSDPPPPLEIESKSSTTRVHQDRIDQASDSELKAVLAMLNVKSTGKRAYRQITAPETGPQFIFHERFWTLYAKQPAEVVALVRNAAESKLVKDASSVLFKNTHRLGLELGLWQNAPKGERSHPADKQLKSLKTPATVLSEAPNDKQQQANLKAWIATIGKRP